MGILQYALLIKLKFSFGLYVNKMLQKIFFLLLVSLFLSLACKTPQIIKPPASYQEAKAPEPSVLNIPVEMDIMTLEQAINEQVELLAINEKSLVDEDPSLSFLIKKSDRILLRFGENSIYYDVPLSIWVRKKTLLGNLEAEGKLEMNFTTNYDIQNDWNVATKTEITSHRWIEKPVLKLGFTDLRVAFLADQVLARYKEPIAEMIDEQIRENLILKEYVAFAWEELQGLIPVSEDPELWLDIEPSALCMSPLQVIDGKIKCTIGITSSAAIVMDKEQGNTRTKKLPPLEIKDMVRSDDFLINLGVTMPFKKAETIARKYVVGQTYSQGRKEIIINDLELYGQGERLVIKAGIGGDYKGDFYLLGTPFFNNEKNQIEIINVDFELQTKNFLLKTMQWLFHKGITRRIQEQLVFPLDEDIQNLKNIAKTELSHLEIDEMLLLKASLYHLEVFDSRITEDAIHVVVHSKGKINLIVRGLDPFGE